MTIHHATAKRAAKLNVELTDYENGNYRAETENFRFDGTDPKALLNAAEAQQMLSAEYPAVRLSFVTGNEIVALCDGAEADLDVDATAKPQAIFDAAIEALQEMDVDLEGGEEPEDEPTGGITVLQKYKKIYGERGDATHCGDWLAQWMKGRFDIKGDKITTFDHVAFARFLSENGVDLSGKWAGLPNSGQRGWQGRYRMNGRQRLEVQIAITGKMVFDGAKVKVDPAFLEDMRTKHAKAIEKAAQ